MVVVTHSASTLRQVRIWEWLGNQLKCWFKDNCWGWFHISCSIYHQSRQSHPLDCPNHEHWQSQSELQPDHGLHGSLSETAGNNALYAMQSPFICGWQYAIWKWHLVCPQICWTGLWHLSPQIKCFVPSLSTNTNDQLVSVWTGTLIIMPGHWWWAVCQWQDRTGALSYLVNQWLVS